MRFGLVLHGNLEGASGGFLYDRMLVERLEARGHTVEPIELAWRSYGECLFRNLGGRSFDAVVSYSGDLLIQDELAHPSLVRANRLRRRRGAGPAVAIVHLLRSSEARSAPDRALSRWVEARYLRGLDGMIFNSAATRVAAESLMGKKADGLVATPGGDRLGPGIANGLIEERGLRRGPLRILFVANLLPGKGLLTLMGHSPGFPEPVGADCRRLRRAGPRVRRAGASCCERPGNQRADPVHRSPGRGGPRRGVPVPPRPCRAQHVRGLRDRLPGGHGLRARTRGHDRGWGPRGHRTRRLGLPGPAGRLGGRGRSLAPTPR